RQLAWEELIRLQIRGTSQKQCAAKLGFHVNTIKKWHRNPEFKLKLKRTRDLVFQRTSATVEELQDRGLERFKNEIERLIEQYSLEAVVKIRELMHNSKHEWIQLKSAIDLADRGTKTAKTQKVQARAQITHAYLTPELLAAAAKCAREILEDEAV